MVPHAVTASVPTMTVNANGALLVDSITCFPSP
jgi:hypothetical protein